MRKLSAVVAGVLLLAALSGYASATPPSASANHGDKRTVLVDGLEIKAIPALRDAYEAGKLVVVKNTGRKGIYEALGLMEGERVKGKPGEKNPNPDNLPGPIVQYPDGVTPDAIGVIKRVNGKPHVINFFGNVNETTTAIALEGATPLVLDPSTPYTGGDVKDMYPRGVDNWSWKAYRDISANGQHWWTVHWVSSVTPGYDLSNYEDWELQQYQPKLNVNYTGQTLKYSSPEGANNVATVSINLGYQTSYSTWSYPVSNMSIQKHEVATSNYVYWDFNVTPGTLYSRTSHTHEPGIQALNTTGSFYFKFIGYYVWNNTSIFISDQTDLNQPATIIVPDF